MKQISNDNVIPPRSVVRLKDSKGWLGDRVLRVGYYSKQDGLNCVWLVNEAGQYEQTVDQKMIAIKFEVLLRSDETDLHGEDQKILGPITTSSLMAELGVSV